ncbi:MAG: hypothetical protein R2750_09935 [Bacteroidales bacterium]
MNRRFTFILILVIGLGMSLQSQNIFVLEKPGKRVIQYKPGQHIRIQVQSLDTLIKGKIWDISDSSIYIRDYEVFLKNIAAVYRERWGFSLLQKLSILAGAGYLVLTVFNGAISREETIVSNEALIISGSLIVGGVALTPLIKRKHKVKDGNWKVKILDFTDY